MLVLVRAVAYATLFIGFVLIFLPASILARVGVAAPATWGAAQAVGAFLVVVGAALALGCVLTFALVGRGTPAPFDPPRRLVVRGPYRLVRNPMYLGAGLALTGAALFYQSGALLAYAGLFFIVTHLFVRLYEEPTLRRKFADEYDSYLRHVGRWLPKFCAGFLVLGLLPLRTTAAQELTNAKVLLLFDMEGITNVTTAIAPMRRPSPPPSIRTRACSMTGLSRSGPRICSRGT
jgi:protein-S-isoprenylcysteine O-methyltransferase Ste14